MSHNYGNKKETNHANKLRIAINYQLGVLVPDEFGRMDYGFGYTLNSIENKDELNFKNVVKLNPR